jgi:anti-sigma factor ChrR (cupin superfamily)
VRHVRTTRPMLTAFARIRRVTHPAPESLIPFALGTGDPVTARHVAACATCQAEVERFQEAAGLLGASASLESRLETPDCLDELILADFVDGRLTPESRAPVVAHLLTCARCRSVVKATAGAPTASERRWPSWSLPLGLAAAAVLVFLLVPRGGGDSPPPDLREPPVTSTIAPAPIAPAPGASVARVDRLVWSSVPGAERYRLRLFDREGSTLWTVETTDTAVALPDSVRLTRGVPYFWRVEAQAEWARWTASDLVPFQLAAPQR